MWSRCLQSACRGGHPATRALGRGLLQQTFGRSSAPAFRSMRVAQHARSYADAKKASEDAKSEEAAKASVEDRAETVDGHVVGSTGADAAEKKVEASASYEDTETVVGSKQTHSFQAETKKLLDIVARSLYTDSEVFVRELISNASDALEKFRFLSSSGEEITDSYLAPEIHLATDEDKGLLIIQDFGIGMTAEELTENIGTIARSGTSEFVKKVGDGADPSSSSADHLIGQFGVGFYSAFMVADNVTLYTRSAKAGSKGYMWTSDGTGSYEMAEADGVTRGTKIVIKLNEQNKEFAEAQRIKGIVSKYSNFVNFAIKLNGEKVNTVDALWTRMVGEITDEEHLAFYKFIAHAYDKPMYKLHFRADTPLNLSSLFYVPAQHTEKFGYGQMEPGVALYCRKVLIQSSVKNLLPPYLRFIKGVVDCEDIPLNLSREHLQDSSLIARLSKVLTRRVLKFLGDEAKKNPAQYLEFFREYGNFLKEGCTPGNSDSELIAKLLRFESTQLADKELTSLDEYVDRMQEGQEEIYYLVAPKREYALSSPYYEHFKRKGIEVLFMFTMMDDWVMSNLPSYKGKKLKSIEQAQVDDDSDDSTKSSEEEVQKQQQLADWIKDSLQEHVSAVKESKRLVDSPAVILDHESISMRRMMMIADRDRAPKLPKQTLEINSKHPIMQAVMQAKDSNPEVAKTAIRQVYDNALVTAGLMFDPRSMVGRINDIILASLSSSPSSPPKEEK